MGQKINVSEDAARILRSATEAAERIIARREALDCEGRQDQTLYVAAGEEHDINSHLLHHMVVLHKLKNQFTSVAVGSEYSWYNQMKIWMYLNEGKLPDNYVRDLCLKNKPGNPTSLHAVIGFGDASESLQRFYRFLVESDIPAVLTDAVIFRDIDDQRNFLHFDTTDPNTAKSIKNHMGLKRFFSKVTFHSIDGVNIRNHHMMERSLEYINEHRPRVFYQQCGLAHVAGFSQLKSVYTNSLVGLAKKNDMPVFALPAGSKNVPLTHMLGDKEFFRANNLPDGKLDAIEDQVAYCNAVLEHLGFADHILSDEKYIESRDASQRHFVEFVLDKLNDASPR